MNATWATTAGAMTFVWLGMVVAISFLETPLKFRAPGVTVPIGLGIGRLVFRALNRVEAVLAAVVLAAVLAGGASAGVLGLALAVVVLLAVQVGVVRRRLSRRSDRVLAGEQLPRSRGHLAYVAFEVAKVALLVALGVALLAV
ncbi:hypothetical protein NMG29_27700 [Streptomyces cocklensis]|uniref:Transmembrane protein n=1 Tax=Actinacidiphila cocklensis TaxID=887465 RepID=A0A9W4DK94_9ACTN|nr:hypothetical protein [Actinacidiphila cocklensis]MDD1061960.1 hypothetical protein [Actinacidiphila cocklensis]CAG6391248.1 conserved membrane hypothetical protein [Actinacidiphila cocklensis]